MTTDADLLREIAEVVRRGYPPIPLATQALEVPPPGGDAEALRAVADDVRTVARGLNDASGDVDKLRIEKLPAVWSGGMDTSAAENRLRATARHSEHASEVFTRLAPCLRLLASHLEAAQRRDESARAQIRSVVSMTTAGEVEYTDGVRSLLAVSIEQMADELEFAEEKVGEAAAELNRYADEAGTRWLTSAQVWVPGMPVDYQNRRMPPEEILLRYRQPDDPRGMVTYTRGVWVPTFPPGRMEWVGGSKRMTATEAEMLEELSLWDAKAAVDIHDEALARTEDRFGPQNEREDTVKWQADAWRHAYWSARMTQRFDEDWAEDFGTAHEGQHGNLRAEDSMDLYNNEVGRRIAVENPDASPEELGNLIMEAIENGEMIVIEEVDERQELHYSDQ